MDNKVKSPCIRVCKYDEEGNCLGCYRSMEEISKWIFMNDAEKLEVLEKAKIRKATPRPGKNDYDYYV